MYQTILHIPPAPVLQMGPPGFIKDGSGFPKTRVLIQILNICHICQFFLLDEEDEFALEIGILKNHLTF